MTEESLTFNPPLYLQRARLLKTLLTHHRCRRVVDAGCASGETLAFVLMARMRQGAMTAAVALDLSEAALRGVEEALPYPLSSAAVYLEDMQVELVRGDLTQPPPGADLAGRAIVASGARWLRMDEGGLQGFDAVFSMEVLEHVPPHRLAHYTDTLFAQLAGARGAQLVVISTPNRDENRRVADARTDEAAGGLDGGDGARSVYSPSTQRPWRRHEGHLFELTAAQFAAYCQYVVECFAPYWRSCRLFGCGGNFTQGAVFYTGEAEELPAVPGLRPAVGKAPRGTPGSSPARADCAAVDEWLLTRDERLSAFPFEEIFGMTREAYDAEFSQQDPSGDDQPRPSSDGQETAAGTSTAAAGASDRTSPQAYRTHKYLTLEGKPWWNRLTEAVYWAADLDYQVDHHDSTTRRESLTPRSKARPKTNTATTTPRKKKKKVAVKQRPAVPQLGSMFYFESFVQLNWEGRFSSLVRCSPSVVWNTAVAQMQAWTTAYHEGLRAWWEFACAHHFRAVSAFLPRAPLSEEMQEGSLPAKLRAHHIKSSPAMLRLFRDWAEADRVLEDPDSSAAADHLARITAAAEAEEGRRQLRALGETLSGLRAWHWVLARLTAEYREHRRRPPLTEDREVQLELALDDDDATDAANVFSESAFLAVFFLAAADVLPGPLRSLHAWMSAPRQRRCFHVWKLEAGCVRRRRPLGGERTGALADQDAATDSLIQCMRKTILTSEELSSVFDM